MFVNFSNHPSEQWYGKQLLEARKYGEIVDVPFPQVDPEENEASIEEMADKYTGDILSYHPDVVMCSGEFSLTYAVVKRLLHHNIKCVCACTKRNSTEEKQADGIIQKVSSFEFVKFREYR